MATLSITVTAGQAARITTALRAQNSDPELTDAQVFDAWLRASLKNEVLNYERRVAINAVNDSLPTEL